MTRRTSLVGAASLLACAVATVAALGSGDYPLSVGQVLGALLGRESGIVATVVLEWRAPRALAAVVSGAALGVAGALFQSLTRNPLASPDVIGVSAGAYSGALVVMTVAGSHGLSVAAGAVAGGLGAAASPTGRGSPDSA